MEFSHADYNVQLVINPADFILRFEHKDTLQLFETICFERDFADYIPFGGIGFIQKLLIGSFQENSEKCSFLHNVSQQKSNLSFDLVYEAPLLLKPITFPFELKAMRREKAGGDVDALQRKMKEMTAVMENKFKEFEVALKASSTLAVRVKELEERCGDVITLPGCEFVIPTNLTSLTLVKDNTEMFEGGQGYLYSSSFHGRKVKVYPFGLTYAAKVNVVNPYTMSNQHGQITSITLEASPNTFVFDNLTNISNLKYLKNCITVILSGTTLSDFSTLGQLTNVQSLSILCARNVTIQNKNGSQVFVNSSGDNNPQLKDISWIRSLKQLRNISFQGCTQLVDITPLKDLPHLTTLDIRETGVKNTDFLTHSGLTITK